MKAQYVWWFHDLCLSFLPALQSIIVFLKDWYYFKSKTAFWIIETPDLEYFLCEKLMERNQKGFCFKSNNIALSSKRVPFCCLNFHWIQNGCATSYLTQFKLNKISLLSFESKGNSFNLNLKASFLFYFQL